MLNLILGIVLIFIIFKTQIFDFIIDSAAAKIKEYLDGRDNY